MNYSEAVNYIENLQAEAGSDLSLKQVKYLADMIGNPENKSRIIHIAGTNGKGSVGNFIAGILAMSGYTVGRYVSPALFDYKEKYRKLPEIYTDCRKNIYRKRKWQIISHILLKKRKR